MKNLSFSVLSLTAAWLGQASAVDGASDTIAFRHVAADEAFSAIKEKVGQTAATAVSLIDLKQNAIVLDATHPETAAVREFLRTFDYRRPLVVVDVAVKKVTPATATTPATEQLLARPTISGRPGSPMSVTTAEGVKVEFVVNVDPGEVPKR